ncbi:MAG TPA: hypothetical protein VLH09_12375 [Bryobacteraceae bacterium]|nr:hypothetical protein [Bryobacteraceae bacterium]
MSAALLEEITPSQTAPLGGYTLKLTGPAGGDAPAILRVKLCRYR